MITTSQISGKTYREVERLQPPVPGESIVICVDTEGNRYACPATIWDSHAIKKATLSAANASINNLSTPAEKVTLFRSLFRGREDVYAKRYYSVKTESAF